MDPFSIKSDERARRAAARKPMMRGLLAEFGIEVRRGIEHALMLARQIAAGDVPDVPSPAAKMIAVLGRQLLELQLRLREIERELLNSHRSNDLAKRIATIPCVGIVCAGVDVYPLKAT